MDHTSITLYDYLTQHTNLSKQDVIKFRDYFAYQLPVFVKLPLRNNAYKKMQEKCVQYIYGGGDAHPVDVLAMNERTSGAFDDIIVTADVKDMVQLSDNVCVERIEDVPFSAELFDMIFPSRITGKLACIKQRHFSRMVDLLDVDSGTFFRWETAGAAKWTYFEQVKDYLKSEEGRQQMIDIHNSCFVQHTFPKYTTMEEEELPLYQKIDLAIRQYIQYLEKIVAYKPKLKETLDRLKLYFIDRLSNKEIAGILNFARTERARQLRHEFIKSMKEGSEKGAENLRFSDTLKAEINSFIHGLPVICSEKTLCAALNCDDYEDSAVSVLLPLKSAPTDKKSLSKQWFKSFDQMYYSRGYVDVVKTYLNALCGVLGHDSDIFDLRPMDLDRILEMMEQLEPDFEFDKQIVMDLLLQHDWIESIEEEDTVKYRMKYPYLKSNYKYLARIVHERKVIHRDDVMAIHRTLMNDPSTPSILNAFTTVKKKIPWVVFGGKNNYLEYNEQGVSRKLLRTFVKEWTQEHILFELKDIQAALREEGYAETPENTLRTYIYESCHVENKRHDLFCHSAHIGSYQAGYSWRNKSQDGIINWIIKQVHGHLMAVPTHTLPLKELENRVICAAERDESGYEVRRNLGMYMSNYLQQGELFILEDELLSLTDAGLELTAEELETIGRRNRKPGYYDVVTAKIVESLKDAAGGELRLVDLRELCMEDITGLTRPAFYKIVDTSLPEQVSKVEKDGKVYLKLVEEKIAYVDTMVLQPVQADSALPEEPVMVKSAEVRPVLAVGQSVETDWDLIRHDLYTQLDIYAKQWDLHLPFEKGVDKFIRFITQLDEKRNARFIGQITHCLKKLWSYRNDMYSYTNYLTDIVTCYERLLREIHLSNTGETLSTTGLLGTIKQMDAVDRWSYPRYYRPNDWYLKYFNYLRKERNNIAHGEELHSNTLQRIVQAIYQYIALYIYTVSRFWEE